MLFIQGGFSEFELLLEEKRLCQQLLQNSDFKCYFRNPKKVRHRNMVKTENKKVKSLFSNIACILQQIFALVHEVNL